MNRLLHRPLLKQLAAFNGNNCVRYVFSEVHKQSLQNPTKFWESAAEEIDWIDKAEGKPIRTDNPDFPQWFGSRKLNMAHNCLIRHVKERGSQTAIAYDSPVTKTIQRITYNELYDQVDRFAAGLKGIGITKGDRVLIFMPNIPQAAVAMLACALIGAPHSVVFGGFAPNELATRIKDCQPKAIVLASCGIDGQKVIKYKPLVDQALSIVRQSVSDWPTPTQIIYQRAQSPATFTSEQDIDWEAFTNANSLQERQRIAAEPMLATDPLYILYTSGTTGAPKGVVRDTGGYAVALKWTMWNVYGLRPGDVFWAASDVGWVVGHSYSVYGPLLHGCTSVLYEGKPVGTPDESSFWRVIERQRVNCLFTAPTALRAIKRADHAAVRTAEFDLGSLRTLFLAGEHADPDTVRWAEHALRVPVVDNWWQTETGWPICANMIGADGIKPVKYGSVFNPCPGYDLVVLDDSDNSQLPRGALGGLAIRLPLPPGCLLTLHNAQERYRNSYLVKRPGYYDTGDTGLIDEEGYVYVMSRSDDVINVAGHRLSTGAMEEVLSEHSSIAECAVVGVKDTLKGQIPIGLFVLYESSASEDQEAIIAKAAELIRNKIGAIACFKDAYIVPKLPKTRSGKVLRATIRAIANGEKYTIPSTIEDVDVLYDIEKIIVNHTNPTK